MLSINKVSTDDYYSDQDDPTGSTGKGYEGYVAAGLNTTAKAVGHVFGQRPDVSGIRLDLGSFTRGDLRPQECLSQLLAGRDPVTGEVAAKLKRLKKGEAPCPPGGYDIQASLPKSVSIFAELGEVVRPGLKAQIVDIHRRAMLAGLSHAMDLGLIATRRDGRHVPVAQCAMVFFVHDTSRADDMQLHHHGVLAKTALAADGKVVQVDNFLLMRHKGAIAALIRAEEVKLLHAELGLAVEQDRRGYRLAGVPPELEKTFSKRREAITRDLAKSGKTSGKNRVAAQRAAYETREAKSNIAAKDLRDLWASEAAGAGWSPEKLAFAAETAAQTMSADRAEAGPAALAAARRAMTDLAANSTIFTKAEFFRVVFESVQCHGIGADAALALAEGLIQGGDVLPVSSRRHEQIFTHRMVYEAEQRIIRSAEKLMARAPVFSTNMKDALAKTAWKAGATEEQAIAFATIVTGPGLTLLQGAAGTGKTYLTRMVRSALVKKGYQVLGTAPSHKATGGLQADAGFDKEDCRVLAKLLIDIDTGKLSLNDRTVILVDEAGMIGTSDMDRLLAACAETGARVLLQGDAAQYRPVAAGAPFALLQRLTMSARLEKIARQKGRTELDGIWMRAASVDFSRGQTERALEAYDRMGHIAWEPDRKTAVENAVSAYMNHRIQHPDETRAMTIQWNQDAEAVAKEMRTRLKAEGLIGEAEILIDALPRGKSIVASPLPLSIGDDLILGETIKGPGWRLNNADVVRVVEIETSSAKDPIILFEKLGQGNQPERIRASLSQLVGWREEGEPSVPRLQHAYAVTGHAAQGLTVDVHFDLALRPRGQEGTYVCATRHRRDFRMFVDSGRLEDDRQIVAPTRIVTKRGGTDLVDPQPNAKLEIDDLKRLYFAECSREDGQGNASDDIPVDSLSAWARGQLPEAPLIPTGPTDQFRQVSLPRRADLSLTPENLKTRIRQRITAPKGHRHIWRALKRNTEDGNVGGINALLEKARAMIDAAIMALKMTLVQRMKADETPDRPVSTATPSMVKGDKTGAQTNSPPDRATASEHRQSVGSPQKMGILQGLVPPQSIPDFLARTSDLAPDDWENSEVPHQGPT
jgi:conjugative relaxase-like TrwC/TraI family protein